MNSDQQMGPTAKILLVEDDAIIQKIHRIFLEQLGYQVTVVGTGNEALDYAKQGVHDAMVLDLGLPDLSGEFVLSTVRFWEEISTKKRLAILVATAHGTEADLKHCLELGADVAFIKPVSKEQFKEALEKIISAQDN